MVSLERVASHVEVTVSDTGKGIAPEFLPHVFDRFRQFDTSSTRRYGGLGLGLALVKHLIELHGGTVEATSVGLGQGARFTVILPRLAWAASAATEPPALAVGEVRLVGALPVPDTMTLASIHILVVDDQPDARAALTHCLSECGARVTAVSSGTEALAFLADLPKGAPPDVLVCDISMPDEDGYAVLARVRAFEHARGIELSQQIPAIALTALARREDRLRALTAGFRMHVAKPVEPAELVMVIASLTGQGNRGASFI